jgi:hypothetical protein
MFVANLNCSISVTLIAILRLKAFLTVDYNNDFYFQGELAVFYSILEPNLAILCISIPMMMPVYRYWRNNRHGATEVSNTNDPSLNRRSKSTRTSPLRSPSYLKLCHLRSPQHLKAEDSSGISLQREEIPRNSAGLHKDNRQGSAQDRKSIRHSQLSIDTSGSELWRSIKQEISPV